MGRLIDADAIKLEKGFFEKVDNVPKFYEWLGKQPTVDAVPVTDVDELKMRLSGAEAAVNGMREQINRMVIINSEKVSVVRCRDCAHCKPWYWDKGLCRIWGEVGASVFLDGFCSYGERREE